MLQCSYKACTECLPVFYACLLPGLLAFIRKRRSPSLIVEDLANNAGKQSLAAQVNKDLSPLEKRFTKISFYRLFAESRYFE